METPQASAGSVRVESVDPGEPVEPVLSAPPVVAILITHDPGPWLEAAITSLAAQDYPSLSVLVLDRGSASDPTARIAAIMPHAFVRRLATDGGFTTAANEALGSVEGATFLLFCHDDVVFDETALRVMVEEAYRSNAGIVGPKLVDREHPQVLLEVGMSIDHYGVPYSGIELNEVDQEQHDAVRDVFFVSQAAMLVRADLFRELGGFDPKTSPGFDDVDLCWRARLAGARVLVAPDARVGHRVDADRDERAAPGSPLEVTRAATRSRVRLLIKSYSGLALCWVLPTAFILNAVEAVGLFFGRQGGRARGLLAGWWANVTGVRDVRRARKQAQALRRVDDGDIRELMVRGSARVRGLLLHRFRAPDRLENVTSRTRRAVDGAGGRLRHPVTIGAIAVALVLLLGTRDVMFGHVAEVGALRAWPGARDLLRTFWEPWQRTGLGVDAPAPPAYAVMGVLTGLLFGHGGLARTLVVAGAIPLGAWGAFRTARPFGRSVYPALTAAIAYAVNPLPRNAIAQGRLGSLVLYALAPFMVAAMLRAAGPPGVARRERAPSRVVLVAVVALSAIATAFYPAALLFLPLVALSFALAVPLVGEGRFALRTIVIAAIAVGGTAVLLVPWTFAWFHGDGAALSLVARHAFGLSEILRFTTGPAGAGWPSWGLLIAAALPLLVATGPRLAWAGRAWMLIVTSYALAWLPGRLDPSLARPEVEGVLVGAALGIALASAFGVAAFTDDLRQFHFGWRQFAAVAVAFGILLPILGMTADAVGGRWRLPDRDWADSLAWMQSDQRHGDFRVLWMGDADVLPVGARSAATTAYGLTQDGPGDVRNAYLAWHGRGEPVIGDAIGLLAHRQTARFGHLVAPMGVRYIALVRGSAPGGGTVRAVDPNIVASLSNQLDLAVVQSDPGLLLYENRAFAPGRTVVASSTDVSAPGGDSTEAAMRTELSGGAVVSGPLDASHVPRAGAFLFGDAFSARWKLQRAGRTVAHTPAFAWSNAFPGVQPGTFDLHYDGGPARPLWITLEVIAWVGLLVAWVVLRRRDRALPSWRAGTPT
jgi:GT2 family glycosyltransferase